MAMLDTRARFVGEKVLYGAQCGVIGVVFGVRIGRRRFVMKAPMIKDMWNVSNLSRPTGAHASQCQIVILAAFITNAKSPDFTK
ncbi:hypothetical protein WS61_13965 [Burkholderia sp. ABCPW 11]|nr:hypothetical protein WS61_13965 [Burkholderia sp. ABCPW 11]